MNHCLCGTGDVEEGELNPNGELWQMWYLKGPLKPRKSSVG